MTSAIAKFRPTSQDHSARRPLLVAMLVYSLGFVGAAAIVWHGSQRSISHGTTAGVIGCRVAIGGVAAGGFAVAGTVTSGHCRVRTAF